MSRIGKKEIIIPNNVDINITKSTITIKGPKGNLSYKLPIGIKVEKKNNFLQLRKVNQNKTTQALYGLCRTSINNMIIGTSKGFSKQLEIQGVGYRSQIQDKNLVLNVGYSHTVNIKPLEGTHITVENTNLITVHGIDKAQVGQLAATIRKVRQPEPYKGKGIRYINEKVRRKIGKAGK